MNFYEAVEKIAQKDPRYKPDAYEFVMQALGFTQRKLNRKGHVSGRDLLEGIREFGLDQYGPMVKTVFNHWGVKKTGDFGEIVFNMIENRLMGKSDKDSLDDFQDVYDFEEAFDIKKINTGGGAF
ncbi:MAG: Minf_1886 family protein [Candidatus Omnitrophota bacterium]